MSALRSTRSTLLTAVAPAIWGTTYFVATEFLPPGHPLFTGMMRALPAGLLALCIARQVPRGAWWWRAAVLGVLNIGAFFPLLFIAAERLPGGVAATLGAVQPLVVASLARCVTGERPGGRRFAWAVAGAVGIGLVVLGPAARLDGFGLAAGLSATASMGLGLLLTRRWGRPVDTGAIAFAGWQLTAGGLMLAALVVLTEDVPSGVDARAGVGYAWLGLVGGLLAYTLWFAGVRRLRVTASAFLGLVSPLVAAGIGAAVLGERFTALQLCGFGIALVALLAGQLPGRPVRSG